MDLRQIKDLMTAMEKSGTKRLRIKQDNFELELEKQGSAPAYHETVNQPVLHHHAPTHKPKSADIPPSLTSPLHHAGVTKEAESGTYVKSPMVGTFYAASAPDEPTFVKVGDAIEKDTVVCVIEAMKVMNEIKSGVSGTVTGMLVENGHPVEFGTKLFTIS